jgi:hypothetical protein
MSQNAKKNIDKKDVSSKKIRELINDNRFKVLQNAGIIIHLKVSKELIEGTEDEYYNKLTIMDTLSVKAAEVFRTGLQNDESYDWEASVDSLVFDAEQQFLLKNNDEQLTVLFDSETNLLGFIDLYGQEIVRLRTGVLFFPEPK